MNILALVPDLGEPSYRFRIQQFIEPLRPAGIHLHPVELSDDEKARWKQLSSARDFEGVLLHRKLLNWAEFWKLRRSARAIVYDFDDAVMFRDSNARRPGSRSRQRRFRRIASGSDLVIAGNSYLAEQAGHYNRNIEIIPTAIDLSLYPDKPTGAKGEVVGWIGTRSNFVYLNLVEEPLRELSRRRADFQFKMVSNGLREMGGVRMISKRWALSEEVADLISFRVGIMPLLPDPWSRGKCAFKIIQYFSSFLPVVCSPVGANREVVQEGRNGFFAGSAQEWRDRLNDLLSSPRKGEEMGRAGRKLVEEKYSLEVTVPKMIEALKKIG